MKSNSDILAIDLGNFHSVFCWYDIALKQVEFRGVGTLPETFCEIQICKPCARVVMDACSQQGQVWFEAG